MKRIVSLLLCMALVLGINSISYANTSNVEYEQQPIAKQDNDEELVNVIKSISIIEGKLEAMNTTRENEFSKMIREYEWLRVEGSSLNPNINLENIPELIQTLETINEICRYNEEDIERGEYAFHPIYSQLVADAIAYFHVCGYYLSAELLTHAFNNTSLDSVYEPTYGYIVSQSSVYWNIANGTSNSGSSVFPNVSGTVNKDLYYAIHYFGYIRNTYYHYVYIYDRYDFEQEDTYSGLLGVAVGSMYNAQVAGVIVPFYTTITQYYLV